jgi:hypothetical protein
MSSQPGTEGSQEEELAPDEVVFRLARKPTWIDQNTGQFDAAAFESRPRELDISVIVGPDIPDADTCAQSLNSLARRATPYPG